MIESIEVTNHKGQSITLELARPETSGLIVRNVDGLGPSQADIHTTQLAGLDGGLFNSARVNSRNIVFDLVFLQTPLYTPTIEDARHLTYKYFPTKQLVKIKVKTTNRTTETYGHVESNTQAIFDNRAGCIISILCPKPYMYNSTIGLTNFGLVTPSFEFPFENPWGTDSLEFSEYAVSTDQNVIYDGDVNVGVLIRIHAKGDANNISIYETETLNGISLDSSVIVAITGDDIIEGDDIEISTVQGNKYVTLTRGGIAYNILNAIGQNPYWFELTKGDNLFTYTADTGVENLEFTYEYEIAYEGV